MHNSGLPAFLTCGAGLLLLGIVAAVCLVIAIFICYLLYKAAERVPPDYRTLAPGSVFLMLVPLLGFVWLFVVVLKLSESYQKYFAAQQRTDVGDCGHAIGLGWAIASVCCVVPLLNTLAAPAALVLMILYLVKLSQLKALVTPSTAS